MIKKLLTGSLMGLVAIGAAAQDPYKIVANVGADYNGAKAYLTNYDTGEKTDSANVEAGTATFRGTVDEPYVALIGINGNNMASLFVENGTASFNADTRKAFGSPLNDSYNEISEQLQAIEGSYNPDAPAEERQAVIDRYNHFTDSVMEANIDNPIGYSLLLGNIYGMPLEKLEGLVAKSATLGSSVRVSKSLDMARRSAATGEGKPYKDFEVNGQKLSDYVGKDGKYLLVDFWASWCGPCRREIPGIKKILEENSDKLNVLGVAVWDEPDATRDAMKQLDITWPVIIDAQRIPTDIYGIMGIPTILLISPDGTILVRDKQGAELKDAVEAALTK